MPILNYTSTVSAARSLGEIQERLAEHGAEEIAVKYNKDIPGEPSALIFHIAGRTYRLPANIYAMEMILYDIPKAKKTREQAARTAWRCIKDWVEAQLALIEAAQVDLTQVMLPYLELPTGQSMYDAYREHGATLLGMGKE